MLSKAAEGARRTAASVRGLAEAADKIGSVVDPIYSISAETTPLSLDTMIETLRANERW